ncbi:MAG: class I SAM-dependent methyltransferase [Verrucomicrobiales bacterium]|nr:class I SAM-dependent methyltransferase [Verrucomicrobiales bacterium]
MAEIRSASTAASTNGGAPASAGCPLCDAQGAVLLERLALADLDHEYRRQVGVSVMDEFPTGTRHLDLVRCGNCGLEYFNPMVAGSAGFYARLSQDQHYYSTTRWEFTETLKRLPTNPDLIDVGCGDGFFLKSVPGTRRRGLEFNPEAVRRATASGLNVTTQRLEDLPAASADFVTLFQVLEHVARPREVMAEAVRVLRPGGKFFVAVPNNDTWVGEAPPNPLNAPPHHTLRWRREALRAAAKVAGLELEELQAESVALEHLFPYRRSRWVARLGFLVGGSVPRYGIGSAAVGLRKVATALTTVSMRCFPGLGPAKPGTGHSLLAIYRKPV